VERSDSRLADLADTFDYSTHEKQVILAKQLIEHGANVSAVSIPQSMTPLHMACYAGNVTNLDFVEYLLEAGANPNTRDRTGNTPLLYTAPDAPGAVKFLLNWPTTDFNLTLQSGEFFVTIVRWLITTFSDKVALPDNPNTNSCSSSGVRSKRSWWKGEPLIPVSQPFSNGFVYVWVERPSSLYNNSSSTRSLRRL
jgi:hypothetical protein